jgi:hypothetical protein
LIINWLEEVANELGLKERTLHWAILLHDRYMEKSANCFDFSVRDYSEIDRVLINSLACLFLAAKNYEIDPKVPSSTKFVHHLPQ